MIMQIALSIVLVVLVGYSRAQRRRAPLISDIVAIVSVTALVFVWRPDWTNDIAAFMGIGRGADLLMYCFVMVTLIVTFLINLRLRVMLQQITDLARYVALQNAQRPAPTPSPPVGDARPDVQ